MRATWTMTGDSWAAWGWAASRARLLVIVVLVVLGACVPWLAGVRAPVPVGLGVGLVLAGVAALALRRRMAELRTRSGWAQGAWALEAEPGGLHVTGPSHVSHLSWRVVSLRRHGAWWTLTARGRPPLPIPASALPPGLIEQVAAWRGAPDALPDEAPPGHGDHRFAYTIDRRALRELLGVTTSWRGLLGGAAVALLCWVLTVLLALAGSDVVGVGVLAAGCWTAIALRAPLQRAWVVWRHEDLALDVSLGPSGLYSRSNGAATSSPWAAFSGVAQQGGWVLLRAKSGVTVPLPADALPVDMAQLEQWIRPHDPTDRPGRLDPDNPFAS